jgi:hypothetical protein
MSNAQNKEEGTGKEYVQEYAMRREPDIPSGPNKDVEQVKIVMKQYMQAVENLNVVGTEKLFLKDSKIFESGAEEGNYKHYLENHLIPELKELKSIKYSNYKIDVQIYSMYAFVTETYDYTIIVLKDNLEVKRKGVSTSVLKKSKGEWKIYISHNSSRK